MIEYFVSSLLAFAGYPSAFALNLCYPRPRLQAKSYIFTEISYIFTEAKGTGALPSIEFNSGWQMGSR